MQLLYLLYLNEEELGNMIVIRAVEISPKLLLMKVVEIRPHSLSLHAIGVGHVSKTGDWSLF